MTAAQIRAAVSAPYVWRFRPPPAATAGPDVMAGRDNVAERPSKSRTDRITSAGGSMSICTTIQLKVDCTSNSRYRTCGRTA